MIGYITGFTEEKMKEIKENPYYAKKYASFIAEADKWVTKEPPRIKYSQMHLVESTGNRSIYEQSWYEYLRGTRYL